MRRLEQVWVWHTFKKKLKKEALERNTTVAQFTKQLGDEDDFMEQLRLKNEKTKFRFRI